MGWYDDIKERDRLSIKERQVEARRKLTRAMYNLDNDDAEAAEQEITALGLMRVQLPAIPSQDLIKELERRGAQENVLDLVRADIEEFNAGIQAAEAHQADEDSDPLPGNAVLPRIPVHLQSFFDLCDEIVKDEPDMKLFGQPDTVEYSLSCSDVESVNPEHVEGCKFWHGLTKKGKKAFLREWKAGKEQGR